MQQQKRGIKKKIRLKNPSQPGRTMLDQNNRNSFHQSRRTGPISKRSNAKIQSGCSISHPLLCGLSFLILAKVFNFVCNGVPILMSWLLAAAMFDGCTKENFLEALGVGYFLTFLSDNQIPHSIRNHQFAKRYAMDYVSHDFVRALSMPAVSTSRRIGAGN